MFLINLVRLWSASMLLLVLMGGAASDAQPKPPATSIMVYQGWG